MRRESQCARSSGYARPAAVLRVDGPLDDGAVERLCARLRALRQTGDVAQVTCEIGPRVDADARTLDALARLQLTARQLGGEIRLSRAPSAVFELLAFAGLGEIVPRVCG
jgi:ABC-type transporter Mla MlaB component